MTYSQLMINSRRLNISSAVTFGYSTYIVDKILSCLLTIKGNRIEVVLKDFMSQRQVRQVSWMMVNMCTRFNGTWKSVLLENIENETFWKQ